MSGREEAASIETQYAWVFDCMSRPEACIHGAHEKYEDTDVPHQFAADRIDHYSDPRLTVNGHPVRVVQRVVTSGPWTSGSSEAPR